MTGRLIMAYRKEGGKGLGETGEDITEDLERILHDVRQAENGCNIDDDGPCKQCAMEARKRLERILVGDGQ